MAEKSVNLTAEQYLEHCKERLESYFHPEGSYSDLQFVIHGDKDHKVIDLNDLEKPIAVLSATGATMVPGGRFLEREFQLDLFWPGGLGFRTADNMYAVLHVRVTNQRPIEHIAYTYEANTAITLHTFTWTDVHGINTSLLRLEEDYFIIREIDIEYDVEGFSDTFTQEIRAPENTQNSDNENPSDEERFRRDLEQQAAEGSRKAKDKLERLYGNDN